MLRLRAGACCSIVAALTLGGCAMTESEGLATSSLWPRYILAHQGDGTVDAQAIFRVGGPTGAIVELTDGDHMELDGVRMTEWTESVTDYTWSRATIDATPDGVYDLTLVRPFERVSTQVETPAHPRITGTTPADVVAWGDTLTITWDATEPGDGVEIRIEGDCVMQLAVSQVPDTGSYTTQVLRDGGQPVDACPIDVKVLRGHTRGVDAAFGGGWSETYRLDVIQLTYDTLGS